MAEKTIDPCCGCIKLRTGCLILGYLRMAAEIALGALIVLVMINFQFNYKMPSFWWMVILLLFLVMSVAACILLLIGLHKNERKSVEGYINHARRCIVLTTFSCVAALVRWMTDVFTVFLIILLLQFYQAVVLKCHCESMSEKPATTAVAKTPPLQIC